MVSLSYSEAAVEVLDILKHTRKKDVSRIPKKFIEFLENNKSKTYISNLDHSKSIKEMDLKPKTEAILGMIYLKWWANEEEKELFKNKAKENEIKYQKDLREKYNTDNMFNKRRTIVKEKQENIKEQETSLTKIKKDRLLQKIMKKIKSIFKKKS